jgi:hypothetical protein
MSNTEKLIKQLNENKEIRKLQEKVVKPAVRIQQVKNNLIILAHDLLVVIGRGHTPVKILSRLRLQKIYPRRMSTTTCKGNAHGLTPKLNIYTKI